MLYVSNVLVYWSEDVQDECSYYINRNTDIWKPYTEHAQHKRQTRAHDLNRIHSTAICTCESWLNSQECRRSVRFIISPENRTQHHLIVPHKLCRNYVRKKTHTHTFASLHSNVINLPGYRLAANQMCKSNPYDGSAMVLVAEPPYGSSLLCLWPHNRHSASSISSDWSALNLFWICVNLTSLMRLCDARKTRAHMYVTNDHYHTARV